MLKIAMTEMMIECRQSVTVERVKKDSQRDGQTMSGRSSAEKRMPSTSSVAAQPLQANGQQRPITVAMCENPRTISV